jgi:HK97 family phage prohead protease
MLLREHFASTAELKFVGDPTAGMIEGYGSVFGNQDSHGDQVEPGAFDATLAEHKSAGTMPFMFGEHSAFMLGGDPYPIGMWTDIQPDEKGLKVSGQLIALDHPDVSRVRQLVLKGALRGLSMAWRGREGGIVRGTKAGEPKRWLKSIDLYSVDLVSDPANRQAQIEAMKSTMMTPNAQAAAQSLIAARDTCEMCMKGGDAPTSAERQQIVAHLNDAHKHITGQDMPPMNVAGTKSKPETIRLFEELLREHGGYSHREARLISERGIKSLLPRDEDEAAARAGALREIGSALSGFSLKPTGD